MSTVVPHRPTPSKEFESSVKSTVENLSDTSVKLTVEIPFTELDDAIRAAYKRISAQVNVPGFRRGKIPARIIDQRFGRGVILEEVVNQEVPKAYDQAILDNELRPFGQPDVDVTQIEDGDLIEFTATVEVAAPFDLPDYEGLEVEVVDSEVTDADVDEQVEQLRVRFATVSPVERPAEAGDLVLVDVKGEIDGVELEDFAGSALTFEVGAEGMIDGFSEAVSGASEGDTVTFVHTPDEGPHADEQVTVTVDVKGVRQRTLPDLDDEFAQLASEFDTIDELREDIRGKLQDGRLAEQAYEARDKVSEQLLTMVDFSLPERFLQAQIDSHFGDGHGDAEHRAEVADNTRRALKTQLILDRIADAESVEVDQAELVNWLIQQASAYGMTPDQLAQELAKAGQVGMALADVRRGKALALVVRKARVSDAAGNPVDLSPLDREPAADLDEEDLDEGGDGTEAEEAEADSTEQ